MRKLFTFFLALVASIGSIYAYEVKVDGIWYNLQDSNKTASVSSCIDGLYTQSNCVIRDTIEFDNSRYVVTSIDSAAFLSSECNTVTLPATIIAIGAQAFHKCWINEINLSEGLRTIGAQAFSENSSLHKINIPSSVQSVGADAFVHCPSLPVIDSIRYADSYLIEVVGKNETAYTIQPGTRWIAHGAFQYCYHFNSIEVPEGVEKIEHQAFEGIELQHVSLPASLTEMEECVFAFNDHLVAIDVDPANPNFLTIDGALFTKDTATLLCYPGGLTGAYTVPQGTKTIGEYSFEGHTNVTSVRFPSGVTTIGQSAFFESNATSFFLPEGLTTIEAFGFASCEQLHTIAFPSTVDTIGVRAFSGCNNLTSLMCKATTPPGCGFGAFEDVADSIPVYVPAGSVEAYRAAGEWSRFTNILPIQGATSNETVRIYFVNQIPGWDWFIVQELYSDGGGFEMLASGNAVYDNREYNGDPIYYYELQDSTTNMFYVRQEEAGYEEVIYLIPNDYYRLYIDGFYVTLDVIGTVLNGQEGLEDIAAPDEKNKTRKILIDGVLYILRDGNIYTAQGVKVK